MEREGRRFQAYVPRVEQDERQCEVCGCRRVARWWDAQCDALWCDGHAYEGVAPPFRMVCLVCGELLAPGFVRDGVCVQCRAVMPLLWVGW